MRRLLLLILQKVACGEVGYRYDSDPLFIHEDRSCSTQYAGPDSGYTGGKPEQSSLGRPMMIDHYLSGGLGSWLLPATLHI